MPRYRYQQNQDGDVIVTQVRGGLTKPDDLGTMPFNRRMLRAHYLQECEKGARFKAGFSKRTIKRVYEDAIAREQEV